MIDTIAVDRGKEGQLLALWGIKNEGNSSPTPKDLSSSWSCPQCTYLNTSVSPSDVCMACSNVCSSRRYVIKRRQLLQQKLAFVAAESLSQQHELMRDLIEDIDDDSLDAESLASGDVEGSGLTGSNAVTDFRYIAPTALGKQLHMVVLSDLLLDCLSYLDDPRDVINTMLACKYFSCIADNDGIWWTFQSRFINDPSSNSLSKSNGELTSEKSSPSRDSLHLSNNAIDRPTASMVETWVCSRCSLTQALASSTHCEMCLTQRTFEAGPTSAVRPEQSAFVIVESLEHLAALWVEGNKLFRDNDSNLSRTKSEVEQITPIDDNSCTAAAVKHSTVAATGKIRHSRVTLQRRQLRLLHSDS